MHTFLVRILALLLPVFLFSAVGVEISSLSHFSTSISPSRGATELSSTSSLVLHFSSNACLGCISGNLLLLTEAKNEMLVFVAKDAQVYNTLTRFTQRVTPSRASIERGDCIM